MRYRDMMSKRRGWVWPGWIWSTALLLFILIACSSNSGTQANKQGTTTQSATGGTTIQCQSHSNNPVTLNVAYSSEKETWMKQVVPAFNQQHISACDGPIKVVATPYGSGQSMQEILDGTIQPDVWSPAGTVWISLMNTQWQAKHGTALINTEANDNPSLVKSPIVIAMWKPQAEALGWPQKAIGWSDISKLSTDVNGWADYGHPEFGAFKFGHTNPEDSNSGLDAVIAMNYAAVNKTRDLTNADVNSAAATSLVSDVESSVIHYGDSTGFFANEMFTNGPDYLSAAIMYENLVVEANIPGQYPKLPYPVVSIYPKEGTFYSDHPYTILQHASWMTPAKEAAATAFRNFLLSAPQQVEAEQQGFRPANASVKLGAPLDSAHGVDLSQPQTLLQVPSANIAQTVQNNWLNLRRPVDVDLVLDRSGSMNDTIGNSTKIDGAKSGLREFVNLMSNNDELGLTTFSDQEQQLTSIGLLGPKRSAVVSQINGITAAGSTKLYDTIADEVKAIKAVSSKHIKAVVVLTDGDDTASSTSLNQLLNQIRPDGINAGNGVKVFTIAYGSDANTNALTQIANTTGGQEYAGTPQNIKDVYNQISEFF